MALSLRGKAAETSSDGLHIWKAVDDLYHPITNPSGYATLGVAENTLMAKELSEHLHRNFQLLDHAFTYGDGMVGTKRIKAALAKFLGKQLKPTLPLEPEHFTVTNGCSSAVEHLSWMLADPGDAFLLGRPYYNTFVPDLVLRARCKVVPVNFHGSDPLHANAHLYYEAALKAAIEQGQRVRGLVISNPHNPLGRCYSRESLVGLMQLCARYDLHLISDEIYALSVWNSQVDNGEAVPFESCLSLNMATTLPAAQLHTIWGMSKDFGANGLRIGAIISQSNPSLHAALVAVGLYSSPSSVSDHITANILEDEEWTQSFLLKNRERLAARHKLVVQWAKDHGIPYAKGNNATFFLWVDLGTIWKKHNPGFSDDQLDNTLMRLFLDNKVYISAGNDFGSERPGWFRIVFAQDEILLITGLNRIAMLLKSKAGAKL